MSILIRTMQPDDLDAVLSIASDLPTAPHWPRSGYEIALATAERGRRVALVAEEPSGEISGVAVLSFVPPEAELESIAVAARFQRRGIARTLLACVFGECKAHTCTDLILEVRESNEPAQALYRAAGFKVVGRRPGYYSLPSEDALLLRREIVLAEK